MDSHNDLGMVLVISGPSGVGKDTVWKKRANLPALVPTRHHLLDSHAARTRKEGR